MVAYQNLRDFREKVKYIVEGVGSTIVFPFTAVYGLISIFCYGKTREEKEADACRDAEFQNKGLEDSLTESKTL